MSPSQDSQDVVSHATPPPDTKPGLTCFPQFLSARNSTQGILVVIGLDSTHPIRFESLHGGFPSRWASVGFCLIDASIRGWQGLPSGYLVAMYTANQNGYYMKLLADSPSSKSDQLGPVETDPDNTNPWSSGDCFEDINLCCLTCWCPWYTFGRIAEAVDDGETSCVASAAMHALMTYMMGYGWKYSCIYRTKMRKKFNLDGSNFKDCLIHSCCETCALCQEYRELQFRGLIVSSGMILLSSTL
ncbi:plant cadmium resistance 2-like protein [Tanacetum coccineum]